MKPFAPTIAIPTPAQKIADNVRHAIPAAYAAAVSEAGGIPLLLPVGTLQAEDALALCDGLLLAGGGDIDPARFGPADPLAKEIDRARDEFEITLCRAFIAAGKPVFGICRGLQVLNVALGGTLKTDIPGHVQEAPRDVTTGIVKVEKPSRLAAILGDVYHPVNSFHHQAIAKTAASLLPTAFAEDGTVEAAEGAGAFTLGVQWHPECLRENEADRALFRAFIRAAKGDCE